MEQIGNLIHYVELEQSTAIYFGIHFGRFLQKLDIVKPYHPAVMLLDIYPHE